VCEAVTEPDSPEPSRDDESEEEESRTRGEHVFATKLRAPGLRQPIEITVPTSPDEEEDQVTESRGEFAWSAAQPSPEPLPIPQPLPAPTPTPADPSPSQPDISKIRGEDAWHVAGSSGDTNSVHPRITTVLGELHRRQTIAAAISTDGGGR
jgi:hypothetical protein